MSFQRDFNLTTYATGVFNSTLTRDIALPVNATITELDNIPLSEVQGFKEPSLPWYSDQILPFDITVAAANEYGAAASCKLFGVEILNEGFGSSVDDSVLEMQATFVARSVAAAIDPDLISALALTVWNSVVVPGRTPVPDRLPASRITAVSTSAGEVNPLAGSDLCR